MNNVLSLETFLVQKNIKVSREWLQACLEYISEQLPNSTLNKIREEVYKQWISGDLSEMGCYSLPPKINSIHKIVLTGKYILQVNSVRDISQPAYGQLLKVKGDSGQDNINVSGAPKEAEPTWQVKPNRMLYLEVTDGKQDLHAMEYRPIPHLKVDLSPGTKVLICGPVECRMGVILLQAKNVQCLGGEVQTLLEINSQEQILTRALGQVQIEPGDILAAKKSTTRNERLKENLKSNENSNIRNSTTTMSSNVPGRPPSSNNLPSVNSSNNSKNTSLPNSAILHNKSSRSMEEVFQDDDDDDEIFNSIDLDSLTNSNSAQMPQTVQKENDFDDDFDFEMAEKCFADELDNLNSDNFGFDENLCEINSNSKVSFGAASTSSYNVFQANRNKPDQLRNQKPDCTKPTFTRLLDLNMEQLLKNINCPTTVTIKGFLSSVVTHLNLVPAMGWQMRVKISDTSTTIEVDIADSVLCELVGLPAKQVQEMTIRASMYPEIRAETKAQINQGMERCKKALLNMNGIMELKIVDPRPVLTKYIPNANEHTKELKNIT